MIFSNNFISLKIVFLWLVLIVTTVLFGELAQRSAKAQLNTTPSFDLAKNYKVGELDGVVIIRQTMPMPLVKEL